MLRDFATKEQLLGMCPCQILEFLKPLTESEYDKADFRDKIKCDTNRLDLDRNPIVSKEVFDKWFERIHDQIQYDQLVYYKDDNKPIKMNCIPLDMVICNAGKKEWEQLEYENDQPVDDTAIIVYKWTGDVMAKSLTEKPYPHQSNDNIFKLSDTKVIDVEKTLDFSRFEEVPDRYYYFKWIKDHYYIRREDKSVQFSENIISSKDNIILLELYNKEKVDELAQMEDTKTKFKEYITKRIEHINDIRSKCQIKIEHFDTIEKCQKHCPLVGAGVKDILFGSGINKVYDEFISKYPNLIKRLQDFKDRIQNEKADFLHYKSKLNDFQSLSMLGIMDRDEVNKYIKMINNRLDNECESAVTKIEEQMMDMLMSTVKGEL